MEDKTIICKDCGNDFTLTVTEQNWYKEMGFSEPKRCFVCRRNKRNNNNNRKEN